MASKEAIEGDKIFNDKIRLAQTIIDREFTLITEYSTLLRRITSEELEIRYINDDYNYTVTWQLIVQIYDLIEHSSGHGRYSQQHKEDYEKLHDIINEKYKKFIPVTFDEFVFCYNQVRTILAYGGFNDVSSNQKPIRDFLAPTQKW